MWERLTKNAMKMKNIKTFYHIIQTIIYNKLKSLCKAMNNFLEVIGKRIFNFPEQQRQLQLHLTVHHKYILRLYCWSHHTSFFEEYREIIHLFIGTLLLVS